MIPAIPELNLKFPEYSVSEISYKLKELVEDVFSFIKVRGEISGLKIAASGHYYFNLKDESSVINCVMWKGTAASLSFKIEEGAEVVCSGKITTYPARSVYQLVVNKVDVGGVGALLAMLEARKKKLALEGLFASERKKAIPKYPNVIGVVTSPTGAVIRDIIHRISDRYPLQVILWPVIVQGAGAAEQIAHAIEGFNNLSSDFPQIDTLIVGRGGGSIEDLWAFNEEIVVRAAANSRIPIISAVGHETDNTLIDLVADMRAPTPTAAAELATPLLSELKSNILDLSHRNKACIGRVIVTREERVAVGYRLLQLVESLTVKKRDKLTILTAKFSHVLLDLVNIKVHCFTSLSKKFNIAALLGKLISEKTLRASNNLIKFDYAYATLLNNQSQKVELLSKLMESYHYRKVLERGFAIIRDQNSSLVTTADRARSAKSLEIEFKDGKVTLE